MRKLRLSDAVRMFVLSETRYLKTYSKAAAIRFQGDIRQGFQNLLRHPNAGRLDSTHPVPGVRRMALSDYVVYYVVTQHAVDILLIRHSRQNEPWTELPDEDDFEA